MLETWPLPLCSVLSVVSFPCSPWIKQTLLGSLPAVWVVLCPGLCCRSHQGRKGSGTAGKALAWWEVEVFSRGHGNSWPSRGDSDKEMTRAECEGAGEMPRLAAVVPSNPGYHRVPGLQSQLTALACNCNQWQQRKARPGAGLGLTRRENGSGFSSDAAKPRASPASPPGCPCCPVIPVQLCDPR